MSGKPVELSKCRIGPPYRASWCWLGYVLFGASTFYLDETNAMRSTSVPEYLFLLSGRKSEGLYWTGWNFIKKQQGFRSAMNEIPAVFAHLLF